jgi:hypothetical protein
MATDHFGFGHMPINRNGDVNFHFALQAQLPRDRRILWHHLRF